MILLNSDSREWVNHQIMLLEKDILEKTGKKVKVMVDNVDSMDELLVDDIIKIVSNVLFVPVSKILSRAKNTETLLARYVCLEVTRQCIGSLKAVFLGKIFNRDHTTILHSYRTIDNMIETNYEAFLIRLDKVMEAIKKQQYVQE